jgi:hypothetical protein
VRKYARYCCTEGDIAGRHCAFCSMRLCETHEHDVEVEGHIFQACEHCAVTLAIRRPGSKEHCVCHDEEYCDTHVNVSGIG